jgi:shikimate dehydrogenase
VKPWPERLVLIGHPVGHSLSPRMQNAALRAASIPLTYEPLDIARSGLDDAITELRRSRAAGNVTIPYKEVVCRECDRLTDAAEATSAVNTFWVAVDGALVGDNTDVPGFQAAIDALGVQQGGARVTLLGAGGGASAVLSALEGWDSVRVRVYARTPERAERLVESHRVNCVLASSIDDALTDATLLVNATPIGLKEGEAPLNPVELPNGCAVFDLVYRQGDTTLVQQAKARGLKAADGLGMLVEQGALAFERWFGTAPDRNVMWEAVRHR